MTVPPIPGGGGPLDKPPELGETPKPFSTEEKEPPEQVTINPEIHPLAQWFVNKWGWSHKQALSAEKQFLNNIMHQCEHILNKYKHMYKKLSAEEQENQ
jgi:hypothetical protein